MSICLSIYLSIHVYTHTHVYTYTYIQVGCYAIAKLPLLTAKDTQGILAPVLARGVRLEQLPATKPEHSAHAAGAGRRAELQGGGAPQRKGGAGASKGLGEMSVKVMSRAPRAARTHPRPGGGGGACAEGTAGGAGGRGAVEEAVRQQERLPSQEGSGGGEADGGGTEDERWRERFLASAEGRTWLDTAEGQVWLRSAAGHRWAAARERWRERGWEGRARACTGIAAGSDARPSESGGAGADDADGEGAAGQARAAEEEEQIVFVPV